MMDSNRPDPDELLARVQAEEARRRHGKLKIFFGASAGVGKTYAMLEAAHERCLDGTDVVVGWVDTHGRAETEALLEGLETIPRRPMPYRGTVLYEFDLDAALARHPALILVDELAHTNAPGSRHAKRWQDMEELLEAGIDVYSTVNVQHLESLNDSVAQITGVIVRETIPDSILERVDEVELIDLPPDDLLQRLREGKVYVPHQAERAARNFFRKGNLIALREMALRQTADRVDAQMQAYMRDHAITRTWPAGERLLVCVSPSPLSARLVRAARRMAAGLRADWLVVYVETPSHLHFPEADRERVVQTLRLAEQLGAEVVTLSGHDVAEEILTYARRRNVTKIIAGKPTHPRWRDVLFGSLLDELVRRSGDMDVYVISGDQEEERLLPRRMLERTSNWSSYAVAALVVAAVTVVARLLLFSFLELSTLLMIYLLAVVFIAAQGRRGPSILASVLSVAAFDFFFVPPYLTFAVADTQYLVTFAVMLVVALLISTLTVRLQQQAHAARRRERRTSALYTLSRELASTRGLENLLKTAVRQIAEVFESHVAALLPDASGRLTVHTEKPSAFPLDADEQGVAQWVYEHGQIAGLGTNTLPGAEGLYLPLTAAHGTIGVLGLRPQNIQQVLLPEQFHLLETFASQTAVAVERATLAEEAQWTRVQIETERLRSSLLSSVSHDLRTPLATITGSASALLENGASLSEETQHELLLAIHEEAVRLNRLVANLLDMTRLESGAVVVQKEWHSLEETIGSALTHLDSALHDHPVMTQLPEELPLVPFDSVLIEQVLINLLENSVKYSPPATPIEVSASLADDAVIVGVADRGPGVPPGDEERIFAKFYRTNEADTQRGVGLGLAIARAIVEAHGGRIWAEQRSGGGALLRFLLPLGGPPPTLETELPVE